MFCQVKRQFTSSLSSQKRTTKEQLVYIKQWSMLRSVV